MKSLFIKRIKYRRKSFVMDMIFLFLLVSLLLAYTIFSQSLSQKSVSAKENKTVHNEVTITLVGDVMTTRFLGNRSIDDLFSETQKTWSNSDLVVANIEQAVVKDLDGDYVINRQKINLAVDEERLLELQDSGIDLFNFANNHVADYGYQGINDLLSIVQENELKIVGLYENSIDISKLYYSETFDETNVAIVAISDAFPYKGVNSYVAKVGEFIAGTLMTSNMGLITEVIEHAVENNDIVIIYAHWGVEYALDISDNQSKFADLIANMGVDLIVGSHSHVLQPIDFVNDVPVVYSLGNFVFDQVGATTSLTVSMDVNIQDKKIQSLTFYPFKSYNGKPVESDSNLINNKILRILSKYIGKSTFQKVDENGLRLVIK